MEIKILYSKDWKNYELLDTGEGEKLERFGEYTFIRPHEDAVWPKTLSAKDWDQADGKFWSSKEGAKPGWKMESKKAGKIAEGWPMSYNGITFKAMPTAFRHLGFFPEEAWKWDFIENEIKNSGRRVKFLNLFGYTGIASLFALRAGAEVTHLDASKGSLDWAKENQSSNTGLKDLPMRVIEDDAVKFLEREIKRGNKYDAIIMDPPKFGRGPKGEVWKIESMLPRLLELTEKILSDKPLFVILTSYAIEASSLSLRYALEQAMKSHKGKLSGGELCVFEKSNSRPIPLANTALWQSE
jgi:23S rRNA (cytosine1962-C5)-methyltransferase